MISLTRKVKAHEKRVMALELRKAGLTLDEIARQVGYRSAASVHNAIRIAMQQSLQEPADEVRQIELERLDKMHRALWPQAIRGEHGAIDRVLRIMERRAKLIGLDAPAKQVLQHGGDINVRDLSDDELQAIVAGHSSSGTGTAQSSP